VTKTEGSAKSWIYLFEVRTERPMFIDILWPVQPVHTGGMSL